MQKLALVDLSTNRFEGSIPLHFFTAMPALLLLDLHDNELTGVIPAIPIENTMLRFLSIHNNQIRGQIPASIANLQGLAHLDGKLLCLSLPCHMPLPSWECTPTSPAFLRTLPLESKLRVTF
jgi:hypothetical protein